MNISKGYESNEYKTRTLSIRGQKITVRLHQLNCWVAHDMDPNFDMQKDVSHLCHMESCVRWDHLNHETKSTNSYRRECVKSGICSGHNPEPQCILWCFVKFESPLFLGSTKQKHDEHSVCSLVFKLSSYLGADQASKSAPELVNLGSSRQCYQ